MDFVRETGVDPRQVRNVTEFVRYANKELGCEGPVGKDRYRLYAYIKNEMEAQEWTFDDLVKTVRYCKAYDKKIRSPYGVLYHVYNAQRWKEREDDFDLQMNVGRALHLETDEVWLRRLSLASGKALGRVFDNWLEERGDQFGFE